MFRSIPIPLVEQRPTVEIYVDGRCVTACEGEMLAAALLKANLVPFRHTPVSGQPRAPLCLMGVCFDCLVQVDENQNVQSCMVSVRAGMRVRMPHGARRVEQSE